MHAREFRRVVHERQDVVTHGRVVITERRAAGSGARLFEGRIEGRGVRDEGRDKEDKKNLHEVSKPHQTRLSSLYSHRLPHLATTTVPVFFSLPAWILYRYTPVGTTDPR